MGGGGGCQRSRYWGWETERQMPGPLFLMDVAQSRSVSHMDSDFKGDVSGSCCIGREDHTGPVLWGGWWGVSKSRPKRVSRGAASETQ